jgi:Mg2+-importing ATPase
MRTTRPFFRSRPGTVLLASTLVLIAIAFAIPYVPFARLFGFVPLSASLMATIAAITLVYVAATELQKRLFYRINPVTS